MKNLFSKEMWGDIGEYGDPFEGVLIHFDRDKMSEIIEIGREEID